MGNQASRQRVDSRLEDQLSGLKKFSSFSCVDTRLGGPSNPSHKECQLPGQVSEDATEYSEFGSTVSSLSVNNEVKDNKDNTDNKDNEDNKDMKDMEDAKDTRNSQNNDNLTLNNQAKIILDLASDHQDTQSSKYEKREYESEAGIKEKYQEQPPCEKKQVSIVDSNPSASSRRRSKFQRQDTPLHPEIISLKPSKRPNILKSLSAQHSSQGNSLPISPISCRSSSVDTRGHQALPPPPPLGSSAANRLRHTNNLNTSTSITSNSSAASPPSFVCSVDYAESPLVSPAADQKMEDEFAIFVKASIHPPNELSVPRCYPETPNQRNEVNSSTKNKNYSRSKSISSPYSSSRSLSSQRSLGSSPVSALGYTPGSRPSSPRPRLRRESAQEIENGEYPPGINVELVPDRSSKNQSTYSQGSKSLSVFCPAAPVRCPSPHLQARLPAHRSAPGTPSTQSALRMSRSPSRTPSDETYLRVPYIRSRGTSLPESMHDSLSSNLYLLRQFNIRGKKVVHLGDSYQSRDSYSARTRSNSSVNSMYSGGQSGHSSFSRPGSGVSSMDNYSSSTDEEQGSHISGVSTDNQIQTYRVIMLGSSGVGKTSLVHKFLSGNYSNSIDAYENDRVDRSVCVQLEDVECHLIFIDKPRSEISAENLLTTYNGDCNVVVFSVTEEDSLQEAEEILDILWKSGNLASRAAIVVGNKTDLVRTRTVPIDKARGMASSHDCKYCEVSATLDHNVDSLLVGIVKQIQLKLQSQIKRNKSTLYTRRKSAGVRMRGIIDKVMGNEAKSKSCDDLYEL